MNIIKKFKFLPEKVEDLDCESKFICEKATFITHNIRKQ